MRLTQEAVANLVGDYEAGLSTRLQGKYGLSKGSVLRLLAEAGVQMRRRGLSAAQVAAVKERYGDGLTIREIAAELGVPKTTVQDALERPSYKGRSTTELESIRSTVSLGRRRRRCSSTSV